MFHLAPGSDKSGYCLTLISFLKGQIGAGMFAMGDAYRNAGLVLGSVLTIFLGVICTYGCHLIVNSAIEVKARKKLTQEPSFPEVVEISFQTGPEAFRRWSSTVRRTVKTFIVMTQIGFCSVYFLFVAQSAQMISQKNGVNMDVRVFIAIVFPIVVASSMIRTIKLLTPLSFTSNILLIVGVILTVAISAINLPSISERRLISPASRWPLFVATTIYTFEGISLVIPIRSEMKDSSKFDKPLGVLNVTMAITVIIILGVGSIGYLKYGDNVKGSLTLNLPDNAISESVQILVAIGVLFTYPIQFFVASDMTWKEIKDFKGASKNPNMTFAALKIALVFSTACLAAIVPHLNLFISLIGAACSTSLAFIFPPLCDIALRSTQQDSKNKTHSETMRYAMDSLLLLVGIIGFSLGSYYSLAEIIAAFETGED